MALALIEHGDLSEAEEALAGADLDAATAAGAAAVLIARSRLRRLSGDREAALDDALAAGELVVALHADVPAWLPWRTEAALAVLDVDRPEARRLARDQLRLARVSAAPRALGIALHTAGVAEGGTDGLALLREAVAMLEQSHASLDRAHALAGLGAALREARDPIAAREPLRRALATARRAGATLLERRIGEELAASGDRVHRGAPSDVDAMTPVERRVVDLATDGLTADEIADALFVTVKAVEWHLRSASHKLGGRSREQLLESMSLRDS
jgi:DNA-binding CsgD family transcriptional regulator